MGKWEYYSWWSWASHCIRAVYTTIVFPSFCFGRIIPFAFCSRRAPNRLGVSNLQLNFLFILTSFRGSHNSSRQLVETFSLAVLFTVVVKQHTYALDFSYPYSLSFFSFVHPFILADNRHYIFYIFKNIVRPYPWVKYACVPCYCYALWAIKYALSMPNEAVPVDLLTPIRIFHVWVALFLRTLRMCSATSCFPSGV